MAHRGKKYLTALKSIESRPYPLTEAIEVLKKVRFERFDATFELAVDLNIDPRQANQLVRGTVTLPHGTGKPVRVLALVPPDKEKRLCKQEQTMQDWMSICQRLNKAGLTLM